MWTAELHVAAERWRSQGLPLPDVALCTGTGLSLSLGRSLYGPVTLSEWLPFDVGGLPGHPHEIAVVALGEGEEERRVLHLRGRLHAYQGYSAEEIVFACRLASLLGARSVIHGNAAGSLDPELTVGSLALIEDHLNLTGLNPLVGRGPAHASDDDALAAFVDMTQAYDAELRLAAREVAAEIGLDLGEGVYAGLLGPSFETPAEIRMLRVLGARLVGMSTVLEVIACRQAGMRNLAFSLVTNLAAGLTPEIGHDEIFEVGRDAWPVAGRWLEALLVRPELA